MNHVVVALLAASALLLFTPGLSVSAQAGPGTVPESATSSAGATSATSAPSAGTPTAPPALVPPAPVKPTRTLDDQETAEFLKQLHQNMGGIRSASVEFKQETHRAILEEVIQTSGRCLFQFPNNIRFEICEPFQSVVIANGQSVAKYEKPAGQWKKLETPGRGGILAVMNQIALWLQGDFGGRNAVYDISILEGTGLTVKLVPRNEAMLKVIAEIDLELSQDRTRFSSLTLREANGDYSIMNFVAEQRGLVLPKEAFDLTAASPADLKLLFSTPAATAPSSDHAAANLRSGQAAASARRAE